MSELVDNAKARRAVLKHLILQLHEGSAPDAVKPQLLKLLGRICPLGIPSTRSSRKTRLLSENCS